MKHGGQKHMKRQHFGAHILNKGKEENIGMLGGQAGGICAYIVEIEDLSMDRSIISTHNLMSLAIYIVKHCRSFMTKNVRSGHSAD